MDHLKWQIILKIVLIITISAFNSLSEKEVEKLSKALILVSKSLSTTVKNKIKAKSLSGDSSFFSLVYTTGVYLKHGKLQVKADLNFQLLHVKFLLECSVLPQNGMGFSLLLSWRNLTLNS